MNGILHGHVFINVNIQNLFKERKTLRKMFDFLNCRWLWYAGKGGGGRKKGLSWMKRKS